MHFVRIVYHLFATLQKIVQNSPPFLVTAPGWEEVNLLASLKHHHFKVCNFKMKGFSCPSIHISKALAHCMIILTLGSDENINEKQLLVELIQNLRQEIKSANAIVLVIEGSNPIIDDSVKRLIRNGIVSD